ncbi:MAG: TetR/AcrR family transcriptional regulator [Hahellaceae bacterium]|nr:TetR/AcrR family transcriptional regulator [Hahellaceae bacterium]
MANSDTVDRILDAAEILFAEKGFSETSLRQITSKAQVNLAAVNYHFGSKNALIQAVFARFLTPFTRAMEQEIDLRVGANIENSQMELEQLLSILTLSIVRIPTRHKNGVSVFMRLLGIAYTQSQGHLRRFLEQEYSRPFRRFMRLMKAATPELSQIDRFWRIQFMLGATAFTMSSIEALKEIIKDDLDVDSSTEDVATRLVPFLAAGLRAKAIPDPILGAK